MAVPEAGERRGLRGRSIGDPSWRAASRRIPRTLGFRPRRPDAAARRAAANRGCRRRARRPGRRTRQLGGHDRGRDGDPRARGGPGMHWWRRLGPDPDPARVCRPRSDHRPPGRRASRLPRRGARGPGGLLVADAPRVGDGPRDAHRAGRAARGRFGAALRRRGRPDGPATSSSPPASSASAASAGCSTRCPPTHRSSSRSTATGWIRRCSPRSPPMRRAASAIRRLPRFSAGSAPGWRALPSPSMCPRSTSPESRRWWRFGCLSC